MNDNFINDNISTTYITHSLNDISETFTHKYSSHYFLNCLYTNPTSLHNKMNILEAKIANEKPDILFFAETWFREDSCPSLKGYNIFRRDRKKRIGGCRKCNSYLFL